MKIDPADYINELKYKEQVAYAGKKKKGGPDMSISALEWLFVALVFAFIVVAIMLAGIFLSSLGKNAKPRPTPLPQPKRYVVRVDGYGDDLVSFTVNENTGPVELVSWNGSGWKEFELEVLDKNLRFVRNVSNCHDGCTTRTIVDNFPPGEYYLEASADGKWWFEIQRPTNGGSK